MSRGSRMGAGRVVGATTLALLLSGVAHAAQAQSPLDIFATHAGSSRSPSRTGQDWYSANFVLMTEFDGRFDDPDTVYDWGDSPVLRRQDGLTTSAGYNYLTYGRNRELSTNAETWFPFLPTGSSMTLAWSAHVGMTHDAILTWAQNGLHDFRGVTRNYHPNVTNYHMLAGLDIEALLWPGASWFAFGGHLSMSTFHQEEGLTAIASDRTGDVRAHLAVTVAALSSVGAGPTQITSLYNDWYWSVRTRVDAGDNFGVGATYHSGTFPGEREILLSFHVAAVIANAWSFRIEHVNDLLGGKDRGFTGGARLAFVRRI